MPAYVRAFARRQRIARLDIIALATQATIDPERIGIGHCTDCQTLSGAAFRTGAIASKDSFRLLTGQPKIYVKTAQRGRRVRLTTKFDQPQAAVPCLHASDGGVIGPEAHDILARVFRRSDVDRNKVSEDDAVLRQTRKRIKQGFPPQDSRASGTATLPGPAMQLAEASGKARRHVCTVPWPCDVPGNNVTSGAAVHVVACVRFFANAWSGNEVGKLISNAATDHARSASRSALCGSHPGPRICSPPPHPR
jgi:glutathione-dependent formaldehyde-activating enzyme